MLDDVAEKARRNLMMVATGILAVWGLGIPLDGKLVGAVDLSAVEPWRAWLAAIAVLVYFAARHYFAPSTAQAWTAWRYRLKSGLSARLAKEVSRSLRLFNNNGERLPYISLSLPDKPDGERWEVYPTKLLEFRRWHGAFQVYWGKPAVVPVLRSSPDAVGPLNEITNPEDAKCKFTLRFYTACLWQEFRSAYTPSWNLLELSLPWFLAFGAMVVCIWRLGVSLYYSFPFVRQLLPA